MSVKMMSILFKEERRSKAYPVDTGIYLGRMCGYTGCSILEKKVYLAT
jgi:hypothetical protein